ncbi:MAG: hypothetical protein IKX37_02485 [Bacteroidales bacterium]|nr:hypothetical protein [Bacteroidales bacterium]
MKNTYILWIIAAFTLTVACSKEINSDFTDQSTETVVVTNPNAVNVPVISGLLEQAATKSGMEFIDTDKRIETWWLQGDHILVTDGETDSIYESTSETQDCRNAASFAGSGSFDLENGLWAISPATAVSSVDGTGINFNINTLVKQDPYGVYTEWSKNDIKGGYSAASSAANVPTINFRNLTAILRLHLKLGTTNPIHFEDDETLEAVRITAVGNEPIAGKWKMPFSADVTDITLVDGKSEITCEFPEGTKLSSSSKLFAYIPVAPVNVSSLLVTIVTSRHTIQRTIMIGQELERNSYLDIKLTKIENASPYTVVTEIPIPAGGKENYVDENSTAGAVIALFDGVYGEDVPRRYYTVQLAKDQNFSNIVLTTNIQITYTTIYSVGGQTEVLLSDGKVTFCGLEASTRYYYRVKIMGVSDDYYSQPNTFVTKERNYKWEYGDRLVDFDDVKSYGKGDAVGRAVATFPGATPVTDSQSTLETGWNHRLGFVESDWATTSDEYKYWNSLDEPAAANTHAYWLALPGHSASYRVGSDLGAAAIKSSNPFTSSIQGVTDQAYCYNRPGYIELGKTDGTKGYIVIPTIEFSNGGRPGHVVTFKACTYDSDSDTYLKFKLHSEAKFGITYTDDQEKEVKIYGGRAHQWREYSVTITCGWRVNYNKPIGVLTIETDGQIKVLLDDIHITRASGY